MKAKIGDKVHYAESPLAACEGADALLIATEEPLTLDDICGELQISRGNAHTNLKELVAWGLVRVVVRKGERREFFEAEKDVWKMWYLSCEKIEIINHHPEPFYNIKYAVHAIN